MNNNSNFFPALFALAGVGSFVFTVFFRPTSPSPTPVAVEAPAEKSLDLIGRPLSSSLDRFVRAIVITDPKSNHRWLLIRDGYGMVLTPLADGEFPDAGR